jgi:MOSC domain-containing protein YiiM
MSKKLAISIAKSSGVTPQFAITFLRNAAQAHAARMHHAQGKRARAVVRAHYDVWLRKVRNENKLAYYGYNAFVHEYL